jgi:uncharacterized protein YacL (UPF0231 family)
MASMMNGYRFDMAKEGANEYAVSVNGKNVISGSNFASALDVFKYIEESISNAGTPDVVHVVKEYDAKTKRHTEEVVRSNVRKKKKAIA